MAWTPAPPYTRYDPPQRPVVWVLDCLLLLLLPTMFTNVVLFGVQSIKHQTHVIGVLDGVGGTLVLMIVIGLCYAVLLSTRAPRRPRLGMAIGSLALVPLFLAMAGSRSLPAEAAETLAPTVAGAVVVLAVLFRALGDSAWSGWFNRTALAVPLALGIWLAVGIADATGVDPRLGYPVPTEPNLYAVTVAVNQDWLGRRWFPPELAAPSLVIYAVALLIAGVLYTVLLNRQLAPGAQLIAAGLFLGGTAWSIVDSIGAGVTGDSPVTGLLPVALQLPASGNAVILAAPLIVVAAVRLWRRRRTAIVSGVSDTIHP
jgi:hypothetical protein